MRSKRLARSNKTQDVPEKTNNSGTDSTARQGQRSNRMTEPRKFLSTSTPAKQVRSNDGLSDDTDDEISLVLRDTPTGLRMKNFFRDEFLSSQNTDSQLDVKWDHTSPDAYRRLQRVPKKTTKQVREDLSDIVCRLAPSVNGDGGDLESVSSTPPLLCSWLQANKATTNNAPFEGQIFRQGHRAKRGFKKKRSSVKKFDDVLNNLHMCLERLDHDEEAENDRPDNQRSSRSSVEDDIAGGNERDHNKNIVRTDNHNNNHSPGTRSSTNLLPKDAALALLEEEEDLWSDDELFEDNSFILQATQLPTERLARFSPSLYGGKRKQISPVMDQPKNKTKRCAVSPKWENESNNRDVIPPTCAANGRRNGNMRTNVNNNVNYGRQNSGGFMPGVSKAETNSTARSPFRKHSSFSGYESGKPKPNVSSTATNCKSPWRKTSSFSGRLSNTTNQRTQPQATASKPQAHATAIKPRPHPTASRPQPQATAAKPQAHTTASKPPAKPPQNCLFRDGKASTAAKTTKQAGVKKDSNNQTPIAKNSRDSKTAQQVSPSYKRTNLDTSLSDEILRQLAEPDEILESQVNEAKPGTEVNRVADEFEDFFDSDNDFSIDESVMIGATQPQPKCSATSAIKPGNILPRQPFKSAQQKNQHKQIESNQNRIAKLTINPVVKSNQDPQTNNKSLTNKPSPRQSSQSRFTFRSTSRGQPTKSSSAESRAPGSRVSPKQHQQKLQEGRKSTGPRVSPTQQQKLQGRSISGPSFTGIKSKIQAAEELTDTQILMSSQSLLEDDSFMKDDALFESQILAMLDVVESTQTTNETKTETFIETDKISCSPEEIEKKRLAALAKRKEKNKR